MASKKDKKAVKVKKPKAKPKANKQGDTEKRSIGRPTDFKAEYCEQAYKLCLLTKATDKILADFFEVDERTVNRWKIDYPEFCQSIRAGKTLADMDVAKCLFDRATGAKWKEEVAFKVKQAYFEDGKKIREIEEIKIIELQKAAPPETQAVALWLNNRDPERWRKNPEPTDEGYVQPVKIEVNVVNARKPENADA